MGMSKAKVASDTIAIKVLTTNTTGSGTPIDPNHQPNRSHR